MNAPLVTATGRAHARAAASPVGATLIYTLLSAFAPMAGFLFKLLAVPVVIVWAVVAVFRIVSVSVRGDWRSSAVASIVFLGAWPIMAVTMGSEDYIHLALMYPFYMAEVREAAEDQSMLTVANWGSIGTAVSAYSDRILIYDGGDEITAKSQVRPLPSEPAVKVRTNRLLGRSYFRQMFWG